MWVIHVIHTVQTMFSSWHRAMHAHTLSWGTEQLAHRDNSICNLRRYCTSMHSVQVSSLSSLSFNVTSFLCTRWPLQSCGKWKRQHWLRLHQRCLHRCEWPTADFKYIACFASTPKRKHTHTHTHTFAYTWHTGCKYPKPPTDITEKAQNIR